MKIRRFTVKVIKWAICIVVSLMLFTIVKNYLKGIYDDYQLEYTSTATTKGKDVVVEIPSGATESQIAEILKKNGLIKYKTAFTRRLSNSEYSGKLHSGTYTFNTGMNTLQMMELMAEEKPIEGPIDKLVVPEGFTIDQIAARCEEQNICTKSEFIKALKSVTTNEFPYLADVPDTGVRYRLEGFLFPATYDIYKDTTAESLVDEMIRTFKYHYTDSMKEKTEELGPVSYTHLTLPTKA